ncbi:hypothetical protein G9F73_001295 [Clostridium estertheticum]|nr:hypothetical protein [Clostridium estertheticum]MBZ9606474.1 hypothetical protein [Clostridium estertheticum]
MNRNKKTKSKKVNDAIANMENSTGFQPINDINSNKCKDKNNIPEGSN